jgi:hypothetical protein
MAKLKNIIKQLSKEDFENIYNSLIESSAEKSAYLLKFLYQNKLPDSKIMEELDVNSNAYYTLRSRLNQKIEEYLLEQIESPRTDLLKKVANITEVIFTKKRPIIIATLKKLEKELKDYDLSNELTIVYKTLKRLHIHQPEQYYNYSQLYNRHVAYMLSVDKAEMLITEYFKKYGDYFFTQDETDKLELTLMRKELLTTAKLYDSHRLYIFKACVDIFHRLFVEPKESMEDEPIEDMLRRAEEIFSMYNLDPIYYHLQIVFEFLRLEYYNHYKVYRKVEDYFDEVNDSLSSLLTNYPLYTFPARFLYTKIERHLRMDSERDIYPENEALFYDFEPDKNDLPTYVSYVCYRALSCYYVKEFKEAAKWLNDLLNDVSLKKYSFVHMNVKLLLALQYCMLHDVELFNQLASSIQRQIRLHGKENCQYEVGFLKILKTLTSPNKRNKPEKVRALVNKLSQATPRLFCPVQYVKIDEEFINWALS